MKKLLVYVTAHLYYYNPAIPILLPPITQPPLHPAILIWLLPNQLSYM
jgi:hypothetical protein